MKRLLLLDGNNLGFRAFGMAPMDYEGQRTEVMRISLTCVKSYLEKFTPDKLIVCWDGGRDASRTSIYPDYKRKKARELTDVEKAEKESFFDQLRRAKTIFHAMGIEQYKLRGREADDVIFSLCKYHDPSLWQVMVVSTDQDFFQLIGLFPHVRIFSPIKKKEYGYQEVLKEVGVSPERFIYWKALVGDASDNLPGVRGVGPKTAGRLIDLFFGEVAPKEKDLKTLEKIEEQLPLMLQLIEFRFIPEEEMATGRSVCSLDDDELITAVVDICQQYGFDHLLDNLVYFLAPFEALMKKGKL